MEQVLVVLYYMLHKMKLTNISLGHIRSAFKDVGKPFPVDIKSTVADLFDTSKSFTTGVAAIHARLPIAGSVPARPDHDSA